MTKYTFITFGKIKTAELENLKDYYLKLLGKYVKVDFRVLKDVENRQIEIRDLNMTKRELGYTVIVSEQGKDFTTEGFEFFVDKRFRYEQNVTFILGNAFGLHSQFFQFGDFVLALSKMTFTHEMAIVLLLEQLYRVANMTQGGSYHK